MTLHYTTNSFPGISNSTSGTTVDAYVIALTLSSLGYAYKNILVTNTDLANSLTFKLLGYLNKGSTKTITIIDETALVAGDDFEIDLTTPYDVLELSVKSTTGSTPATYQIDHISQRGGYA
jgi:hypothetical protein